MVLSASGGPPAVVWIKYSRSSWKKRWYAVSGRHGFCSMLLLLFVFGVVVGICMAEEEEEDNDDDGGDESEMIGLNVGEIGVGRVLLIVVLAAAAAAARAVFDLLREDMRSELIVLCSDLKQDSFDGITMTIFLCKSNKMQQRIDGDEK